MRVIVSYNGGGLTINYENVTSIVDNDEFIFLVGDPINVFVNTILVAVSNNIKIYKKSLLFTDNVYLDTGEEDK